MGYRYYLTAGKRVRYPFGYGLSYTDFSWKNMRLQVKDDAVTVSCDVEKIGICAGADVVQLYVKVQESSIFRPEKELRGFEKVYLQPGEKKMVTITVPKKELSFYHPTEKRWVLETGTYEFQFCRDCQTVDMSQTAVIKGESCTPWYDDDVAEVYGHADVERMTDQIFEKMSGLEIPAIPPSFPVTLESRFTDLQQTFMGKSCLTRC